MLSTPLSEKHKLDITYIKNVFHTGISNQWYEKLLEEIHWQQKEIKLFGKLVMQPRQVAWYGDQNAYYKYSGLSLAPEAWTPTLIQIKKSIEDYTGEGFNSVLLNLYRNGNDSMGLHSDNEKELGDRPTIASYSLGVSRSFRFVNKFDASIKETINLEHNSLLTMKGLTQDEWKHELPKTKKLIGPRINLTFRRIVI